jgi:hypothetical protein
MLKNLNTLKVETLISIIYEMDDYISQIYQGSYQPRGDVYLELENSKVMLNKAYNDISDLKSRKDYWKEKYLELERLAINAGVIASRKYAKPTQSKAFNINLPGKNRHVEEVVENSIEDIIEEQMVEIFNESIEQDEPEKEYEQLQLDLGEVELSELGNVMPTYKKPNRELGAGGNVSGTKHNKHEPGFKLTGIFPDGDIVQFDSWLNDCVPFMWKKFPELKGSKLTNIPRAAYGGNSGTNPHLSYGVYWSWEPDMKQDKTDNEVEENA